MSGVDDLFSPDAPPPPPPKDRLRRIGRLLAVSLPLNLLGPLCLTGVPGAILALIGWQLADEEVARAESGAVPKDQLPRARRMRTFAFSQLSLAMLSLVAQVFLFALGFYDMLLELVVSLVGLGVPA